MIVSLHYVVICIVLQELLDEFGTSIGCSAISDVSQENQFVIANSEVRLNIFFLVFI